MDRKIKSIDLVFENCEYITLLPNMFTHLFIDDIYKSYWINTFQYRNGEVVEYTACKSFSIALNKKKIRKVKSIFEMSASKRVTKYNDITTISIKFDDGTIEDISVPWEDGPIYTENEKQKVVIDKDSIYIEIKE